VVLQPGNVRPRSGRAQFAFEIFVDSFRAPALFDSSDQSLPCHRLGQRRQYVVVDGPSFGLVDDEPLLLARLSFR